MFAKLSAEHLVATLIANVMNRTKVDKPEGAQNGDSAITCVVPAKPSKGSLLFNAKLVVQQVERDVQLRVSKDNLLSLKIVIPGWVGAVTRENANFLYSFYYEDSVRAEILQLFSKKYLKKVGLRSFIYTLLANRFYTELKEYGLYFLNNTQAYMLFATNTVDGHLAGNSKVKIPFDNILAPVSSSPNRPDLDEAMSKHIQLAVNKLIGQPYFTIPETPWRK
jgi:hypothetical protein